MARTPFLRSTSLEGLKGPIMQCPRLDLSWGRSRCTKFFGFCVDMEVPSYERLNYLATTVRRYRRRRYWHRAMSWAWIRGFLITFRGRPSPSPMFVIPSKIIETFVYRCNCLVFVRRSDNVLRHTTNRSIGQNLSSLAPLVELSHRSP